MTKRIIATLTITLSIIVLGFTGTSTYSAEFNPNYVISDYDMQDFESMGRGQIQLFLENKNSFLAMYTAEAVDGKQKRAADIIFDASREYNISPKFLLVMLQKEMSVITRENPTERQLDFAAGYSVCDSCNFNDPKVLKYKGFGKQVDAAAGIMRWYYDNVEEESWIRQPNSTYAIDGVAVSPANLATGFMYTYTPHIEGNKNFWIIWQDWFEQVYPNGTLLKPLSGSDVYLLQNGKKRLVKSMTALRSRFNPKNIIEVPESELLRYESGSPLSFANYSILKQNNTYYLLDFDTIRPFENESTFRSFGYNPQEVIEVTSADIVDYTLGKKITKSEDTPVGRVLSFGTSLYYVDSDSYSPILHPEIASTRFPSLSVEPANGANLEDLERKAPLTFPNATLIGDKFTGGIYVIDNQKRRHITSEIVFLGLGYKWENVIWVDQFTMDIHPLGESVYLRTAPVENVVAPKPPETETIVDKTEPQETTTLSSNELEYTAPENATLPLEFPETGKMLRTPKSETTYYGPKQLNTILDSYVVADGTNGKIIAGKNMHVVRPMASFTKVMTAYRLFYEGIDLNRSTAYQANKHKSAYHRYRVVEGEGVKNSDLMKAMLITSRNTPARMLVNSVSDESIFISKMNSQAKNWGLDNTYFTDSYGYSLKNQSTAADYVRLFHKGLENALIKDYLGTNYFSYDETFDLDNAPHHAGEHTNALQKQDTHPFEVIASKTGYLFESGYNHAMLIRRKSDSKLFYIVTMGYPEFSTRHTGAEQVASWALTNF